MIKARAITIYLEMATGLTISAGESQISLDGGAFANTTNLPTELGTTGKYPLTLTAAEVNANSIYVRITDGGSEVFGQHYFTTGEPTGAVVADGSNTAQTFETDLSESTSDYWKDVLILFTSGSLINQIKRVSAYDGSSKFITANTPFTGAPSGGDLFVLII